MHHHHDVHLNGHWSWVRLFLRWSAASRCCSLRAVLKALLRFSERCERATVVLATEVLL